MATRQTNQPAASDSQFEEKIIRVNRVSKKTKGGNNIGFSVLTVVGDKRGKVGVGLGKGPDVAGAIRKGMKYAKNHLITVPIVNGTIPHKIVCKYGAARVMLKPAPEGTGLKAGGAVRSVVSAAGITNVVAKTLGTRNQLNNVYCAIEALRRLKTRTKRS
jgi:small subunit ribosomal protein S5